MHLINSAFVLNSITSHLASLKSKQSVSKIGKKLKSNRKSMSLLDLQQTFDNDVSPDKISDDRDSELSQ